MSEKKIIWLCDRGKEGYTVQQVGEPIKGDYVALYEIRGVASRKKALAILLRAKSAQAMKPDELEAMSETDPGEYGMLKAAVRRCKKVEQQ